MHYYKISQEDSQGLACDHPTLDEAIAWATEVVVPHFGSTLFTRNGDTAAVVAMAILGLRAHLLECTRLEQEYRTQGTEHQWEEYCTAAAMAEGALGCVDHFLMALHGNGEWCRHCRFDRELDEVLSLAGDISVPLEKRVDEMSQLFGV